MKWMFYLLPLTAPVGHMEAVRCAKHWYTLADHLLISEAIISSYQQVGSFISRFS